LWIKIFQPRAEHTHGQAANIQSSLMGSGIDAQRQTTVDDKTGPGQTAGKRRRRVHARAGSAAAADHRQLRFFQNRRIARDE